MTDRLELVPGGVGANGRVVTLGVLGGGQLGRMFVHAAQALGFRTAVLDPEATSPAGIVSHHHVCAGYADESGLGELIAQCDAVTTEFENVPADSLAALALHCPVSPPAVAVSICQHRAREKAHFVRSGVPCVPHAVIETPADVAALSPALFPAILKSSTLGYDGKGQLRVARIQDLATAWEALREVPCILEQQVELHRELSVIVARDVGGRSVNLPVQQNLHRGGVLALTQVPAPDVPEPVAQQAIAYALAVAESLDYVGVLCVEFFLLLDGSLLANEMAPRPHNSGHYSIDACDLSQFDLQVRTTAGLPLVAPRLHSPAVMLNLLGDLWFVADPDTAVTPRWADVLGLPGAHLHLYGKTEARRGRKMGHLTITSSDAATALAVARRAAGLLGIEPF